LSILRYRITEPILALLYEHEGLVAREIPAGAIIRVEAGALHKDDLINVIWRDKTVSMFSQDLCSRSELVSETGE